MRFALHSDFDITAAIAKLEMDGGVSFPVLSEQDRNELLKEALAYQYERRPPIVGKANVRQDFSGIDAFRPDSLFFHLRDEWQTLWENKFQELSPAWRIFNTPLQFNELSLQRYEAGSLGITPHRDSSCNINLICIFVLTGRSRFGLCADRQGRKIITILDDTPGNAILLRASGFETSRPQPFHFLTDIPELRISFGLRQVAKP